MPLATLIVVSGVVACVGGGGSLSDALQTWDPAPNSLEHATNSREQAPPSSERAPGSRESSPSGTEPGPGAQGVGGSTASFDCTGTYVCQEAGKKDTSTITLQGSNGVCALDKIALESNGTITLSGKAVGSWSSTATGFSVTTSDGTVTCTKIAGGGAQSGSGSGSKTDGGTGTASPPGTATSAPAFDAGG